MLCSYACTVGHLAWLRSSSHTVSFAYLAEPPFEASAAADSAAADSVVAFNVVANSVIVNSVGADRATKLQQAALRCKACHVAYLLCLCSGISTVCHQQLNNLQVASDCSQVQCCETLYPCQLICHAMHHAGKHQCHCHVSVYLLSQIRCHALPRVTCTQSSYGNKLAVVHKVWPWSHDMCTHMHTLGHSLPLSPLCLHALHTTITACKD